MDAENEGLESKNEGVEKEFLPTEKKLYCLKNPPTIKCNYGRVDRSSMGCINLIVGSHDLHNVVKSYVNIVNAIVAFVEPTPPTNIITNETILTQKILK